MAETLISPGVLAIENDQSFVSQQPVTVGAAIIGPTVKGRANIPTLVTSYSDFTSKFGDSFESSSNNYEFLTSIAAQNYFQQGGETILVTRVTSGSYTSAEASISNTVSQTPGLPAVADFSLTSTPPSPLAPNFEIGVVKGLDYWRFIALEGTLPADDTDGRVYFYSFDSTDSFPWTVITQNLATKMNSVFGSTGTNTFNVIGVL